MMNRPPTPPVEPSPPVACTTSRAAPILDTVGAVFAGGVGLTTTGYGIAVPVCSSFCILEPESAGAKAGIIAAGVAITALGVLSAWSAADGYGWASRCENVKAVQLACVSGVEASCAELRRPPPREGKAPGEACEASDECRSGCTCYLGRCQLDR